MTAPQSARNRSLALAVLTGPSYAQVGRQDGQGRVTPGNLPRVFTAMPQDYSANAAKVACRLPRDP